ncbi:MAG: VOC family protein [Christensenellaceae bacterium]|jgi:PhnB protein|nr:VOC family protein [Christensenellaceae bacterium]
MLSLTPNLHFRGDCLEAIQLYTQAFGAQVKSLLRYSDATPKDFPQNEAEKRDFVYHAELFIAGQRLMLSDEELATPRQGVPVSLCLSFGTAGEVQAAFDLMKEGARIVHPMQSTSYSSCFVSLIDRFGLRWELMTEQTER